MMRLRISANERPRDFSIAANSDIASTEPGVLEVGVPLFWVASRRASHAQ